MVTRRQSGFTATEILVVLAIVGLMAALALPSMSGLLASQAVRSASYDLNADLIYARSQAISLGTNVTITGAATTNFKAGWTITEAAGGTTLRTQGARDSKIVFTGNAGVYTFDRTGRVTAGAPAQWSIEPYGGTAQDHQKRCIKLDPSGRPKTSEGVCT
jgi:type IV fimbrial biogenesis protein FimT